MFGFCTSAQGVHGQVLEMLGIVVIACGEGIETTSKPIDGRFEADIIVVGEYDVEAPIQLGRCERVEVLGDEGKADEIGLGALMMELAMAGCARGRSSGNKTRRIHEK